MPQPEEVHRSKDLPIRSKPGVRNIANSHSPEILDSNGSVRRQGSRSRGADR